jgi:pseudaminic acid cytidylyltransferase
MEVLNWYREFKNIEFDLATCIYACAPFVNPTLLKQSFKLLQLKNADCVFPAIAYAHPIQRAFGITENGEITPFQIEDAHSRTQDLTKTYYDAGMFYTFSVESLRLTQSLRTANTIAMTISEMRAQDIDSPEDWRLAEIKYSLGIDEKL